MDANPRAAPPGHFQHHEGKHAGAKTPDNWFAHEGPYAWGSEIMPGALTMSGLYQV